MDLSRYLPSLLEYYPNENSTNVPVSGLVIELRFSTPLDSAVSGSLFDFFSLTQIGEYRVIPLEFVAFEDNYKTIKVRPSGALLPDTAYTFTVAPTIRSSQGRQSGVSRSFTFRTSPSALEKPILTSPADRSVAEPPFFLNWTTTSYSGTGSLVYQVQIARDEKFSDILYDSITTSKPFSPNPSLFSVEEEYWWRVRLLVLDGSNVAVTGTWSDRSSFVFGPVTTVFHRDADVFGVSDPVTWLHDDKSETYNLTQWPALYFMLNQYDASFVGYMVPTELLRWQGLGYMGSVTGYISLAALESVSVDGYPDSVWRLESGTVVYPEPNILQYIPDEPTPEPNRLYRLTIVLGDRSEHRFYFTSRYQPMYVGYEVVATNVGADIEQYVGKNNIYLQIYRTSLDANRHWIRWFGMPPWLGGPSEAQVRSYRFQPTYAVEKWCEAEATARVLQIALNSRLKELGSSHRLGDYSEDFDSQHIREIRELLKDYRKQATMWLAEFGKKRTPVYIGRYRTGFPQTTERDTDYSGGLFSRDI